MKDNFSSQADLYAQYRPQYPAELYDFLFEHCSAFDAAWDCGTGNGQVAGVLADRFTKVAATDMSANQISRAVLKDNIEYRVEAAESSSFPDHSFDLVTVAQAIHWFQFEPFYKEVRRTLKPGGLFAAMGYGLVQPPPAAVGILHHFYTEVLGPFWDAERRYIDEEYRTLPFPFEEITAPSFSMMYEWTFDHFMGFLETWSAVQHYRKQKGEDPLDLVRKDLRSCWAEDRPEKVVFPVLLRAGR